MWPRKKKKSSHKKADKEGEWRRNNRPPWPERDLRYGGGVPEHQRLNLNGRVEPWGGGAYGNGGLNAGYGHVPPLAQLRPNFNNFNNPNSAPDRQEAVKWVLHTCCTYLEEATGRMRISGVPDDIAQFVVTRPTAALQAAFVERERRLRCRGRLMFHGTPIRNLLSILRDGFRAEDPLVVYARGVWTGSVWVAEEPGTSVVYALKETGPAGAMGMGWGVGTGRRNGRARGRLGAPMMGGGEPPTPHDGYGALLGCEVVDDGRGQMGMGRMTAMMTDLRAVMVRYVFLIPPDPLFSAVAPGVLGGAIGYMGNIHGQPTMPNRNQIERQMTENMRQISAGTAGNGVRSEAGH